MVAKEPLKTLVNICDNYGDPLNTLRQLRWTLKVIAGAKAESDHRV